MRAGWERRRNLGLNKGRTAPRNGYLTTPDGRYVHRVVMEEHLERALVKGEVVHHMNHDRTDNRIENLMLLTSRDHAKQHNDRHARSRQSERMKTLWADPAFRQKQADARARRNNEGLEQ